MTPDELVERDEILMRIRAYTGISEGEAQCIEDLEFAKHMASKYGKPGVWFMIYPYCLSRTQSEQVEYERLYLRAPFDPMANMLMAYTDTSQLPQYPEPFTGSDLPEDLQ